MGDRLRREQFVKQGDGGVGVDGGSFAQRFFPAGLLPEVGELAFATVATGLGWLRSGVEP